MIAVIKWTLWQRRWSALWWSAGVTAFVLLTMALYPTFKDQAGELGQSFQDLPEAAVQLFGGSADFFSPVGYLNSQIFFIMLPLLFGMLAVGLASSLLAREEEDKTIELLLARPLRRSSLLAAKALAGVIILSAVAACGTLVTALAAHLFDVDIRTSYILLAGFDCWLLSLATAAVSFLLTATGRARGAAVGIGALVGIAGYLITSLAGTVDWLELPSKFLPFHYYQSEATLSGHHDWMNALFPIGLTLACGLLSWIAFRRRDLA